MKSENWNYKFIALVVICFLVGAEGSILVDKLADRESTEYYDFLLKIPAHGWKRIATLSAM
jgi:hypothetical protein